VPQFELLGPEPLDEALTLEVFRQRLRKQRGMIKNVLTHQRFVAGIGNAYSDEILFEARLFPHRQVSSLGPEEVERLYHAIRSVLTDAIHIIRSRLGAHIDVKLRDFLKVHNKGGQPCPRCGTRISQLTPNAQIISFCRNCQR